MTASTCLGSLSALMFDAILYVYVKYCILYNSIHTLCGTQSFANTQYIRLWQLRFIGLHRTLATLIVLHCIACALRWTQDNCFGQVSWCWFVLSFITSKCWILSILVLEIRCIKWLNGINFCFISTACERIYLYYIDYY